MKLEVNTEHTQAVQTSPELQESPATTWLSEAYPLPGSTDSAALSTSKGKWFRTYIVVLDVEATYLDLVVVISIYLLVISR